jgi:hypothetical protein
MSASKRNRARILLKAAEALGIYIDSIGDMSATKESRQREAQVLASCSFNTLRVMDRTNENSVLYTSGCIDSNYASGGYIVSSSLPDGFVWIFDAETRKHSSGQSGQRILVNEAYNSLPFASQRLVSNKELLKKISKDYRNSRLRGDDTGGETHPDHAWLRSHFGWENATLADEKGFYSLQTYMPLGLHGTHAVENFNSFSRELSIEKMQRVHLRPEVVAIPGMDSTKLRSLSRHVSAEVQANEKPPASACTTRATSGAATPMRNNETRWRTQNNGTQASDVLVSTAVTRLGNDTRRPPLEAVLEDSLRANA